MVAYNPPYQSHNSKSNSKVIRGAIIMILGILIFFCAVFVPIMLDNIFLMFPFFFGGFIIIIIGVITLMIGIKNRSIATGIVPRSRITRQYIALTNKIFGNKNQVNNQQNPADRYDQVYQTSPSRNESRNQEITAVRTRREIICSYCGTSNNIESEICIGCNFNLET